MTTRIGDVARLPWHTMSDKIILYAVTPDGLVLEHAECAPDDEPAVTARLHRDLVAFAFKRHGDASLLPADSGSRSHLAVVRGRGA